MAETEGPAVELVTLEELGGEMPEPVEDEPTFEGNAALKAKYYAQRAGMVCLADDSGLEVDALGGEPGVRSARYAGQVGERSIVDLANNHKLLERLGRTPAEARTARFVCAMAMATPVKGAGMVAGFSEEDARVLAVVRGTVQGRILGPGDEGFDLEDPSSNYRGRGENGFGYDPLFLVPRLGRTTAELSPREKNAISHRGEAAKKMWDQVKRLGNENPS